MTIDRIKPFRRESEPYPQLAAVERGHDARTLDRRTTRRYRIIDTTIAIVSNAIVVIKTLWPQRAITPSIKISR